MVWINEKKYACESCINGHRSSSCTHTLRPLFEVRSKGRPPSQCEECRDARKRNRRHVKCSCDGMEGSTPPPSTYDLVDPRYAMPKSHHRLRTNIPALPNGIRDIVDQQQMAPPHAKQKLQFLLNPVDEPPRVSTSHISSSSGSPPYSLNSSSRSTSWDNITQTPSPVDSDDSQLQNAPYSNRPSYPPVFRDARGQTTYDYRN